MAATEHGGEVGLGKLFENIDRPGIVAEITKCPLGRVEVFERDTGVILDNRAAVGEQKIAHGRKIPEVHEIRRGFEQAAPLAEAVAELDESRLASDAFVGEVGLEIEE